MANADFVTRITLQNQEFQNEIRRCQQEIKNLRNSANQSSIGINSMVGSLAKITGVSLGVGAVVGGIKELAISSIDAYRNIEMLRVSFSTLLGSADKANQLVDSLRSYGANSPYDTEGLAKAAQLMLGYGMKAQQIMPTLEQLGDIAMGDSNKLQSLALAFSQMSAAGKVCKQDLNQMVNAGFNPLQIIAEQTGESIGELNDKVSKGQISVHQIEQAFKDATSEGGKFYNMANNMSNTLDGQIASMADEWITLKQSIGQLIAPAVINGIKTLTSVIQGLNNAMDGGKSKGAATFASETKNALSYANNKAKGGKTKKEQQQIYNKTLDNAIDFETKRLYNTNKQINALEKKIKTHKYGEKVSSGTDDNKLKDTQTLKELKWKRDNINVRIQNYNEAKTANPFVEVPTTSGGTTSTNKGGGGRHTTSGGTEKVIPKGSLADLEDQLSKAQKSAANAVGNIAYQEAMATVRKIQDAIDNFKWGGALDNKPISESTSNIGGSFTSKPTTSVSGEELSNLKAKLDEIDSSNIEELRERLDEVNKEWYTFDGVFDKVQQGWGSIQGIGSGIESITSALDGNKNAWEALSSMISGFIEIAASIKSVVDLIKSMTAATQLHTATTQSDTAATTANTAATTVSTTASAANTAAKSGEAVANATASGAKLAFPYNLIAIAAGVAAVIGALAMIGSFAEGGIINGGSVAGDHLIARVNAGEMILNGSQQKKLFNLLDSNGATGGFSGGNVTFEISGSKLKGVLRNYDKKTSIL